MSDRSRDWFLQAKRNLEQAHASRGDGRDEWACFAAVDLILVLDDAAAAAEARVDTADLPVPADVLVFAEAEWQARLRRRDRFAEVLRNETMWVFGPPPEGL